MEDAGSKNKERGFEKPTPSTVTSNGSNVSNGSNHSLALMPFKKDWDRVASPTLTSAQPRMILHPKKGKTALAEKATSVNVCNKTTNGAYENRAGFIGPRLPTDTKSLDTLMERNVVSQPTVPSKPNSSPMLPSSQQPKPSAPSANAAAAAAAAARDGDPTRRKCLVAEAEKGNGKVANSLVPYDEDSSSSESSLSPTPDETWSTKAHQVLTAKATTPGDWQVSLSRSPSVQSDGSNQSVAGTTSTRPNWNVTTRSPSVHRKNADGSSSSDTEADSRVSSRATKPSDGCVQRASSLDRRVEVPLGKQSPSNKWSPADTLSRDGTCTNRVVHKSDSTITKLPDNDFSMENSRSNGGITWRDQPSKNVHKKFKKSNEMGSEDYVSSNGPRHDWKDRHFDNTANRTPRIPHGNHQGSNSHSYNWRSDGSTNGLNNGVQNNSNGTLNRGFSYQRPNNCNDMNGMTTDRGSENGVYDNSSPRKNRWCSNIGSDTLNHLSKMSHTGFGNNVATWNGSRSFLDRDGDEDRRMELKRKRSVYDEEMDRGRSKKTRKQRNWSSFSPHGVNGFDAHEYRNNQLPRCNYNKNGGYYNKNRNNRTYFRFSGQRFTPRYDYAKKRYHN